ncbi:MAG: imidazole glycerol phosphate synthase subunit HisH [Thermodesulfobacteriota bacterium]
MKDIVIVDYGMCNLDSVARAVEKCGGTPLISADAAHIAAADGIVLPGVGAFADAMAMLKQRGLIAPLREQVLARGTPFLGICLGMQLMAELGHEGGRSEGLGLIPGEVVRLVAPTPETRIPHVGWNEVELERQSPLLAAIADRTDFYFVHSYHLRCPDRFVVATTPYCGGFTSVVARDNCFGTQFHPEKSLADGQALLRNFLALC